MNEKKKQTGIKTATDTQTAPETCLDNVPYSEPEGYNEGTAAISSGMSHFAGVLQWIFFLLFFSVSCCICPLLRQTTRSIVN